MNEREIEAMERALLGHLDEDDHEQRAEIPFGRRTPHCPASGCHCGQVCGQAIIDGTVQSLGEFTPEQRERIERRAEEIAAQLEAGARSPQDEDHEAVETVLNRIIEAASKAGADGTLPAETVRVECLRATYALRVSPSRVGSVAVEDVERLTAELRALVDWFNEAPFFRAERLLYDLLRDDGMSESRWSPEDYEAGKALLAFIRANRSWFCGGRMMEPYESQAAEKLSAYLSRVSPSRVGSVAVEDMERLKNELQALVDWFNEAPFFRAERLLYDLYRASRVPDYGAIVSHHPEGPDQIVPPQDEDPADLSRSSTDRPEQPEPDSLGGQPPSEPKGSHNA
jgi:ribosome maturation factor RimP